MERFTNFKKGKTYTLKNSAKQQEAVNFLGRLEDLCTKYEITNVSDLEFRLRFFESKKGELYE